MKSFFVLTGSVVTGAAVLMSSAAWAKLPAPSDEAKAKAAEAAAKAAHGGKVDGYKLCRSMDQVAATYFDKAKQAGKAVPAAATTAACADPGVFVYAPPAPAAAPVAAAVAAAPGTTAIAAVPAASVKLPAAAPTAATAPKK